MACNHSFQQASWVDVQSLFCLQLCFLCLNWKRVAMTEKYPQGGLLAFLKEGNPQRAVMIGKEQCGFEADP